jgi:cytoskeletal protein CcmA (bactofilin family)
MSHSWRRLLNGSILILIAAAGLIPGIAPRPSEAAEVRAGEAVVVKADETIADNLYVFGRQITIDGTIEGDLIAFGEQITINGTVKGDIAAAGQTVVIGGYADDARIAGQVLKLTPKAKLDGDLIAAGFSLETEQGSTITGDAMFAGAQALLAGQIDKDLKAGLANCRLAGTIGGDVDLEVGGEPGSAPIPNFGPPPPVAPPGVSGGLTIADTAVVTGKLNYLASHEATIDPAAKLASVEHRKPAPPQVNGQPAPPQNPVVATALNRARHGVCVLLVGLAALVCCPRWTTGWADNIRTRPVASFLGGLAGLTAFVGLLILVIVAIVLVAVLAGLATLGDLVPLVIVGGLVGYAAMIVGMWLIAQFLGEAMAGLAIGRFALQSDSLATRVASLVLGVVVIALVLSIPYAGPWIGCVVFLFGLGGFCLWLVGSRPVEQPAQLPAQPVKK